MKPVDVARLLDIVSTADAESVREGALRRLDALRRDELARRRASVLPEIVSASYSDAAVARSGAVVAPSLARFSASVAHDGVGRRDGRTPSSSATEIGRALLAVEQDVVTRIATALGRAQAAFLCRDLDAPSAARLVRRLGDERGALARYARLLPAKDSATLRAVCRRLATSCRADDGGAILVEALGRALLASLLGAADAAVEAAVRRRSALPDTQSDALDAAWISAARAIVAHEARTCRE